LERKLSSVNRCREKQARTSANRDRGRALTWDRSEKAPRGKQQVARECDRRAGARIERAQADACGHMAMPKHSELRSAKVDRHPEATQPQRP